MEAALNGPGRARVQAINCGVGDIGTREEADIFREKAAAIKPDLVVIEFYLNDSRPPWDSPASWGIAVG